MLIFVNLSKHFPQTVPKGQHARSANTPTHAEAAVWGRTSRTPADDGDRDKKEAEGAVWNL